MEKINRAKRCKNRFVFGRAIDSWFYNKQLTQTGNLTILVQGNLRIQWPVTQFIVGDTSQVVGQNDGWDTESPLSEAPLADFYEEPKPWILASKIMDGPRFTWENQKFS